jgi:hypothetical protein
MAISLTKSGMAPCGLRWGIYSVVDTQMHTSEQVVSNLFRTFLFGVAPVVNHATE